MLFSNEEVGQKNWINNDAKLSKFVKNYKSTDLRSTMNSIHKKETDKERHILIRLSKTNDKETILKIAREKRCITHKGTKIRMTKDFLLEIVQMRRQWSNVFTEQKGRKCQPRITLSRKMFFKNEGKHRLPNIQNGNHSSPADVHYKKC